MITSKSSEHKSFCRSPTVLSTSNMPRVNTAEAVEPARVMTRARNATAHPGLVDLDSARAHRNKDDIRREKELKKTKKQEEERKKAQANALKTAGRQFVVQQEKEEKAAAAADAKKYPRHRGMHNVKSLTFISFTYQKQQCPQNERLSKMNLRTSKKPPRLQREKGQGHVSSPSPYVYLSQCPYRLHNSFRAKASKAMPMWNAHQRKLVRCQLIPSRRHHYVAQVGWLLASLFPT